MNFFEDLVVELKEEKLLEDTVMDRPAKSNTPDFPHDPVLSSSILNEPDEPVIELVDETSEQADESSIHNIETAVENLVEPDAEVFSTAVPMADADTVQSADIQFQGNDETVEIRKANSEREFFKKRAVGEMSSLKMVEAVLSAVEREYLKVVPQSFDDLEAKKALHAFLRVADDDSGDEHKQTEFKLLHETESWCSSLAARDKNITVANLRRYCETCRPMLSSQAMLANARFYRNLPHSEPVRGKFDFIITRLFSRPTEHETRKLLFDRDEMVRHVKTLYADWSSVPLYTADEDESKILLTALSFEELSVEAESAPTFDDLIKSDFFGRVRLFKESIAELFFAPIVTVAAIECNVRVGNVYVKLIDRERQNMDADSIHQRFGELDDQTVSEAAGRTLELAEILRERVNTTFIVEDDSDDEVDDSQEANAAHPVEASKVVKAKPATNANSFLRRMKENALSVNRYFLAAAVLIIGASIGLAIYSNYFADPKVPTAGVRTLSFQGTDFADQIKTAKLSGETLYVVAQPTLDSMSKEGQTELLQKLYQAGQEKGWVNVNLMNSEGRTVGNATPSRLEIVSLQ